jgi:hypothetical protein
VEEEEEEEDEEEEEEAETAAAAAAAAAAEGGQGAAEQDDEAYAAVVAHDFERIYDMVEHDEEDEDEEELPSRSGIRHEPNYDEPLQSREEDQDQEGHISADVKPDAKGGLHIALR